MSRRLVLSSRAELDLIELWFWRAEESVSLADQLVDRVKEKLQLLCEHPDMGEICDERTPPTRMFTVGTVVVFTRAFDDQLHVTRVLHSARHDVERMRRRT